MDEADQRFSDFVAARWPALVRTAYLLTGDRADAEDLVQASLAKTYAAWGRIRVPEAAEAYVRRTMATTHVSWWRRHRGRVLSVAQPPEPPAPDGVGPLETLLARSALWPHLGRLPRGQRAVIVLRYYEDLTEAQTADALGVSVGTVKSQTSRALAALRAALGPADTTRSTMEWRKA
jgi:RNA polymerase sigma-70 factor (sigma-E family)